MSEQTASIILPVQAVDTGMARTYARLAEQTRSRRLWSGQSLGIETHALFAALAGAGHDLAYGSAVTLMPMRHPMSAALNARSIAALSGRPYVAGLGPGAASLQRAMLGRAWASPLSASREYVEVMRTLLDGKVATSFEEHWPVEDLRLPPVDAEPVEIGLGVLRPGMARLAGEVADWAITWLTPLPWLEETILPTMSGAAAAAGREAPRVASVLHCVLDRPGRDAAQVALAAAGQHVAAPHYADMLRRSGIPLDGDEPLDRVRALLDHGVIATGGPDDVAALVGRYHAAGVDDVVLNVGGVFLADGPGAAARDLAAILGELEA